MTLHSSWTTLTTQERLRQLKEAMAKERAARQAILL
jgi:hypothetical protein